MREDSVSVEQVADDEGSLSVGQTQ